MQGFFALGIPGSATGPAGILSWLCVKLTMTGHN